MDDAILAWAGEFRRRLTERIEVMQAEKVRLGKMTKAGIWEDITDQEIADDINRLRELDDLLASHKPDKIA